MTLVTNGRLITRDPDGRGYYEHGAVAYEGTKIVEVGEEAALKAKYPDFDRDEVLANPEVEKMMRSGVSMTNAYRSAYFDHILKQQQAATAQQVEQVMRTVGMSLKD